MTSKELFEKIKIKKDKVKQLENKIHRMTIDYYRLVESEEENKIPEPPPCIKFLDQGDFGCDTVGKWHHSWA